MYVQNKQSKLVNLYAHALSTINYVFRSNTLRRFIPLHYLLPDITKTSRKWYTVERNNYRLISRMQKVDFPITKQDYYLYKAIAVKYNWPYIKEVYDEV